MRPLPELRHELHRLAEPSGEEARTAAFVAETLRSIGVARVVEGLGGHGVVGAVAGREPGPRVLLRADLDALPLADDATLAYASARADAAHRCGHDGHMALVLGVAQRFVATPPRRGEVVLLFQPAEETGAGAAAVLADERFAPFLPDFALAAHNLPGVALGHVVLREDAFASASRGLDVHLVGRESHAAEPHAGRSPVPAAAALAQALSGLPQEATALAEGAQVTVVGLQVGGPRFGTTPGVARVCATLRAHSQPTMEHLVERAVALARGTAAAHGLEVELAWTDDFPATPCDAEVVRTLERAAAGLELPVERPDAPFAWSEDFGHFTRRFRGALLGLGSGVDQPPLHAEGYDFPDALLAPGVEFLHAAVRALGELDAS